MNRLILLLLLVSTLNCYSQLPQEKLISKALSQLQVPESKVFYRHTTLQNFSAESIIVLPIILEEDEGVIVFDAYIVLVNNKTGDIISKYIAKDEWYSDALSITHIDIEPTTYRLNDSDFGYGIKIDYANQSKASPYSATELSLFIRQGQQLKLVLKDFRISYLNGFTDTNCNVELETHSKSLEITDEKTNGFYNLKFTDSIEKSVSTDQNCELIVVENIQSIEVFHFKDGMYKKVL